MQFGFRKGRTTIDAMLEVISTARKALKQKRRGNRYCAVATIDVKNAFNNASWEAIAISLHKMKVPDYLCTILKSYFEDRILVYDTSGGQMVTKVTAGVPQGSILGPTLWNIMYNDVLLLRFPRGVNIVGFADDIVLTVLGETREEVEILTSEAIQMVENWMQAAKLQIAHHKTEMVLFSNCKVVQQAEITVGDVSIISKRGLKYLGVMIDDKLSFKSHVDYACEKAAKAHMAMARIMPNIAGPSSNKRRLMSSVSVSLLRYGAPAWCTALEIQRNRVLLNRTYRRIAMRVASAYRTISMEAVCVIAGMIPIGIILAEDSECYQQKVANGQTTSDVRTAARAISMTRWQQEWDQTSKGRWTHRLIPDVYKWMARKHGEINFYLTQFLSGHGCFRSYLNRFGHTSSPFCPECGETAETPEHVTFTCPRFVEEREGMIAAAGIDVNADNIIEKMCHDAIVWNAVSTAVSRIMVSLQRKWRVDQ